MIQISNYAISYSYTCLYPCGEDNVRFVVNNDLKYEFILLSFELC